MPTRLQQARYDGLLRRVGDLKGPGSKVSEVLGDVFPVLDLENVPAELYALNGWALGFGSILFPASMGNIHIAQLFNPAGSGHLIVVTSITMSSNAGQDVEYDVDSGPLADLTSSSIPRDTRRGVRSPLVAQVRQVTQVAGLSPQGQIFVRANENFVAMKDLDGVFILGPGTGVNFATTQTNNEFLIDFHWRERLAEPSELNF